MRPEETYDHVDLIEPTRDLLERSGLPYIIENVPPAPIRSDVRLCGLMFDLRVIRHRKFEMNVLMFQPKHAKHKGLTCEISKYQCFANAEYLTVVGNAFKMADASIAMGIDWMKERSELA